MNKTTLGIFLIALIVSSTIVLTTVHFGKAQGETQVALVQGPFRGTSTLNRLYVTLDSSPQSGDILIASIGARNSVNAPSVAYITEDGVNWTRQTYNNSFSQGSDAEIWAGVVAQGASKNITITFFDTENRGAEADICEYSGIATSNFLDATATAQGGPVNQSDTGTIETTRSANELWIGAVEMANYGQTTPAKNSFTLFDGSQFQEGSLAYLQYFANSAGPADSGAIAGGSDYYVGCIAAFFEQTGTIVSCAPNPALANSAVTCTAIVYGSNPTGTITWSTNSSTGSFNSDTTELASGFSTTTYTDTNAGTVTVTASYSGDSNNPPSVINTTLTINPSWQLIISSNGASAGTVSLASGIYSLAPMPIAAFPNSGYQFLYWVTAGGAVLASNSSTTTVAGSGNGAIEAFFSQRYLINSRTLTIAGSSTVLPIANEEAGLWQPYWNNLVSLNPNWGASQCTSPVLPVGLGSGTAIPELSAGIADIGEMSRPPYNATNEWLAPSMSGMQLWAVGIDSIAIVLSAYMNWFPTNLTTLQVANLFASNPTTGAQYTTWNDFLTANGFSAVHPQGDADINRAVMDPTSGTFDCFNNYFAVPNGFQFEHNANGTVDGSQNMAPYTYCQEDINMYNTIGGPNYIGFISLGYFQVYGHMIGLNVSYNIANLPSSTISVVTPAVWGPYVAPTRDNVIYALSDYKDTAATGQYFAWTYLWEVTPSTIPTWGPLLETGVWIAYMKEGNTTQGGTSDFVNDQGYIELDRDDIAGGTVIDGALQPHGIGQGLAATQTQSIPDGKVNFQDLTYFVSAYIAYYDRGLYNPYADMNADGKINFNDLKLFVSEYITYYTTYVP